MGVFLLPKPRGLGMLHVVVLGRLRLHVILSTGTSIIYPLVFGVGPKAGAGLEASRLVGHIVTRGVIRHGFVAAKERNIL